MCVFVCGVTPVPLSKIGAHAADTNLVWFFQPFLSTFRSEHAWGSGEEKGNYAQWVKSKLSIFRKKAVGSPRDIRGQKPGFSHKMYFQPQGGRRMR